RQQPALHDLAGGVVAGAGGFVPDLRQRRRAEVAGYRAAQRDVWGERIARGELAGELAAEVLVVLVAPAEVGAERLAEAGGQRGVGAGHVAAQVGLVLRGQAAAGLGAGGPGAVGADRMAGGVAGAALVAV